MSSLHLGPGSTEPSRVDGLLRLYSMQYCPFAKRVRLVLRAKNIEHDIVNINLTKKPDWYLQINEKGQVPTLLDNGKFYFESLDIADYLDEKYPDRNPLYPSDPVQKAKDQEVIKTLIAPLLGALGKFTYSQPPLSAENSVSLLLPPAQKLDDELAARGTTFFSGEQPGMIDYMLFPFAERVGLIPLKLGEKLPIKDTDLPNLRAWRKAIVETPVIKETLTPIDKVWSLYQARFKGEEPNYDL
ncbi:hypothetical protein GWI33_021251 [Rhynchophorus ferrugineus]|uniref:Uncharacterized protein n=2 Tax=Rhynchophorus ferrugineus TaxID=354439 RepID=A0A834HNV5_RHYFE|nr:hypothetical protein GWI33_021251 [Rhynchophorus ferrugineus]